MHVNIRFWINIYIKKSSVSIKTISVLFLLAKAMWSRVFNPFTAPAYNISGLKSAVIHACKQYICWSYNKSTFSTVHFGRNPLTCYEEGGVGGGGGGKKPLMV